MTGGQKKATAYQGHEGRQESSATGRGFCIVSLSGKALQAGFTWETEMNDDVKIMTSTHRYLALLGIFLLLLVPLKVHAQSANREPSESSARPVLVTTCVISEDIKRLVGFYEAILQERATWSGDDYAEFRGGSGVLAIFSASAQEKYIPGSAEAGKNRSVVLEFKVADADAEYRRLQGIVKTWVKPPTTQPWGTRSIYFRDPDGNLVDFFSFSPAK